MAITKTKLSVEQKCAAQHFGPWMVEPKWFAQAVAAVKAGTFQPFHADKDRGATVSDKEMAVDPNIVGDWSGDQFKVRYYRDTGVAVVPFTGQVTKGDSSFAGASSVWTRQSLRMAAQDDAVTVILLKIDSPGGTVSGTGDLAEDVRAINEDSKPVYAYIEDCGCSAAYWIASQAEAIFANPTAEVGSIGTMTYLDDTSKAYEKAGIRAILVSTGKYKGAWIDGIEVTDDYVKQIQTEIDDLNEHFLAGVMAGRKMGRAQLMEIADGRVFIAEKAMQLGLIDHVASLDDAMAAIIERNVMTPEQFNAYAAEHSEATARFVEQGKKAGTAETVAAERARAKAVREACGGNDSLACDLIVAGKDAEDARIAVDAAKREAEKGKAAAEAHAKEVEALKKENDRLKAEAGTQGAVGTRGSAEEAEKNKTAGVATGDPEADAKADWKANKNGVKGRFIDEDIFIRASKRNGASLA